MSVLLKGQLGQVRPADTTAVSIFKPRLYRSGLAFAEITSITIVNTSLSTVSFSVFMDNDGTVYDESTSLFWEFTIDPSVTLEIDTKWKMNNSDGNLAVKSSAGNAITFTIFGEELI